MPGGEDSYDLIRTKDERSNSKSDTFSINPKRLGTTDHQVQQIALQTLSGDLTNGNAIDSLTGRGLEFDSGALQTTDPVGSLGQVFTKNSELADDVTILDFGGKFRGFTIADFHAVIELDTPYTDLSALFGSPVAVGDTLEVGDITDGNRTVYDASTDTVGDGTTTADHTSTDSDTYQIDGTTVAEEDGNADLVIKNIDEAGIARLASALDVDGNDVTDSGTTVYDASTNTVGDGTTDANHSSLSTEKTSYSQSLLPDRTDYNPLPNESHSEVSVATVLQFDPRADNPVIVPADSAALHNETVDYVADPRVRVWKGRYLMYFETVTSSYKHIDYATSYDGRNWTVQGQVLDGQSGEGYSGPYHWRDKGTDYILPTQDNNLDLNIYEIETMPASDINKLTTVSFSEAMIDPTVWRFDPDSETHDSGYIMMAFKDSNLSGEQMRLYRSQSKDARIENASWVEFSDSPLSTPDTQTPAGRPLVGPNHIVLPTAAAKDMGWLTLSDVGADSFTEHDTANPKTNPVIGNTSDGRWTDTTLHTLSYVSSGPAGEPLVAVDGNAGSAEWTIGMAVPASRRKVDCRARPNGNLSLSSSALGSGDPLDGNETALAVDNPLRDWASNNGWQTGAQRWDAHEQASFSHNLQLRIGNISGTAPFKLRVRFLSALSNNGDREIVAQKTWDIDDTDEQTLSSFSVTEKAKELSGRHQMRLSQNSGGSLDILSGKETFWQIHST